MADMACKLAVITTGWARRNPRPQRDLRFQGNASETAWVQLWIATFAGRSNADEHHSQIHFNGCLRRLHPSIEKFGLCFKVVDDTTEPCSGLLNLLIKLRAREKTKPKAAPSVGTAIAEPTIEPAEIPPLLGNAF